MARISALSKTLFAFSIPLIFLSILILLMRLPITQENSALSLAITVDLLFTVPFIYFLLIRKTKIPKITVIPMLIVGVVVGSLFLPSNNQYYLSLFKTWGLPLIELCVVTFIFLKVRLVLKTYKEQKNSFSDFFSALKSTCYKTFPKGVVMPLVTEIAVFYYGFIYWKKRPLKAGEFSYHKESGTITLIAAIIFIIGIETLVLHILLAKWNTTIAWILTFLSIYSGIQLFGFLKSMLKRPSVVTANKLFLRYGIMAETVIDLEDIDSIEFSSKEIELSKTVRKLSFLGALESHNTIINLKEENYIVGLYGIKRKYKTLLLHIDNKAEFKELLKM